MKQQGIKIRDRTIVEQMAAIKSKYQFFKVTFDSISLKAIGALRPTARSEIYTVEIKYRYQSPPKVAVLNPKLLKNFKDDDLPHIYTGENLCLYYPKFLEFRYSDHLSDTILPWTSLWLYYYEDWHITGEWHGEGIHL